MSIVESILLNVAVRATGVAVISELVQGVTGLVGVVNQYAAQAASAQMATTQWEKAVTRFNVNTVEADRTLKGLVDTFKVNDEPTFWH